jgi:hypothetical protein
VMLRRPVVSGHGASRTELSSVVVRSSSSTDVAPTTVTRPLPQARVRRGGGFWGGPGRASDRGGVAAVLAPAATSGTHRRSRCSSSRIVCKMICRAALGAAVVDVLYMLFRRTTVGRSRAPIARSTATTPCQTSVLAIATNELPRLTVRVRWSGGWLGTGVACADVESAHPSTEMMLAVLKTFGVAGADVGQDRDAPAPIRLRLAQAIVGAAVAHALFSEQGAIEAGLDRQQMAATARRESRWRAPTAHRPVDQKGQVDGQDPGGEGTDEVRPLVRPHDHQPTTPEGHPTGPHGTPVPVHR